MLKHSKGFEEKVKQRKKLILKYLKKNLISTTEEILKDAHATNNRKYLKKYLYELINDGKIVPVAKNRFAIIGVTVPESKSQDYMLEVLRFYFFLAVRSNEYLCPDGKIILPDKYPKTPEDSAPTTRELYEKLYCYLLLRRRVLSAELKIIQQSNISKSQKKERANWYKYVLNDITAHSIERIQQLTSDAAIRLMAGFSIALDIVYEMDVKFLEDVSYGTRPASEIIRIELANMQYGIKEASAEHIKVRNESMMRIHGKGKITEDRKYPKTLHNTKELLSQIKDKTGKTDVDKVKLLVARYLGKPMFDPTEDDLKKTIRIIGQEEYDKLKHWIIPVGKKRKGD